MFRSLIDDIINRDDVIHEFRKNIIKTFTNYKLRDNYNVTGIFLVKKLFKKPYSRDEVKLLLDKCMIPGIKINDITTNKQMSYNISINYIIINIELYKISNIPLHAKYVYLHDKLYDHYNTTRNKFYNDINLWKIKCTVENKILPFNLEQYLLPIPL